jgi:hypothetical protein
LTHLQDKAFDGGVVVVSLFTRQASGGAHELSRQGCFWHEKLLSRVGVKNDEQKKAPHWLGVMLLDELF